MDIVGSLILAFIALCCTVSSLCAWKIIALTRELLAGLNQRVADLESFADDMEDRWSRRHEP